MIFIKEKCTGCIHHATCKYSELYNKYCDRISDYINDLEDQSDEICNIDITCKYYSKIVPNARGELK